MDIIQLCLFDGKECIKCGWQPIASFGKDASKKNGLQTRCKTCINAYLRGRYHEDINASRKYCLDKYYARPEIYKPIRAKSQKRLKVMVYNRQYNRTYRRKITPQYIELKRKSTRRWAQEHRARRCLTQHKRRALKLGSLTSYTQTEWYALCNWFGNMCLACGAKNVLTVDHVIPLSKGGSNGVENLQPLCRSCNSKKSARATDYRDQSRLAAFLESLRGT